MSELDLVRLRVRRSDLIGRIEKNQGRISCLIQKMTCIERARFHFLLGGLLDPAGSAEAYGAKLEDYKIQYRDLKEGYYERLEIIGGLEVLLHDVECDICYAEVGYV